MVGATVGAGAVVTGTVVGTGFVVTGAVVGTGFVVTGTVVGTGFVVAGTVVGTGFVVGASVGSAVSGEGLVNVYRGTGRVLIAPVSSDRDVPAPKKRH